MTERLVMAGTHRVKEPHPWQAHHVYQIVTARDEAAAPERHGCRALDVDANAGPCSGPIERHHAGNKIGTRRVTAPDRCICLCRGHHAEWAPTHNRAIMDWLKENA